MVSKGRKKWVVRDGSGILVCIYGVLEGVRDGRKSPGRSPYPNIVTSLVIDPPSLVVDPRTEKFDRFSFLNQPKLSIPRESTACIDTKNTHNDCVAMNWS